MRVLTFEELISWEPLSGRRVFIRADLNVPIDSKGNIVEDTRIRSSIPAIKMALAQRAAVMVASHLGRPEEGHGTPKDSLAPVAKRLSEVLEQPVRLIADWVDGRFHVEPGEVVLLENCRLNQGEKDNHDGLARKMAKLCDVFVHDAFGTAHRAEASTYGIAEYAPIVCAGPLLAAEMAALDRSLAHPRLPLVAIVGGAKVSTKLAVLSSLAENVDCLIVGGGIANTFLLAKGYPVGKSLVEKELVDQAHDVLAKMAARGGVVPLPVDVMTSKYLEEGASACLKSIDEVASDDFILDIGFSTIDCLVKHILSAGSIVWNGPVGVFEIEPFSHGTEAIARAVASASGFSIAGGGDTLAAIAKYGLKDKIDYISTGGGAFLGVLEGKVLPAFDVLQRRESVRA